ncbi:MAG TPA: carboxypeptidase-like regulatory domain-containing protein [Bryobacteraceae bacterium]|nr:carboxypeptidase-like regulatory domain-containing protein [Bryobacteraceae bacterium]
MRLSGALFGAAAVAAGAGLLAVGQDRPEAKASGESCRIEGRVTEADGKTPVEGAFVNLNPPRGLPLKTDGQGRYVFESLQPGGYGVNVEKEGYVTIGLRRLVRLQAGERASGIDFRLPRQAVVTGRVFDARRNPLAGALVCAWQMVYLDGVRSPQGNCTTESDDRGEYRLTRLAEGFWYIGAVRTDIVRLHAPPRSKRADSSKGSAAMVVHPNALWFDAAAPIYLRAGEERTGVDIVFPEVNRFCVRGSLEAAGGTETFVQINPQNPNFPLRSLIVARVPRPGPFEICNLAPGSYVLRATLSGPDGSPAPGGLVFAEFTITDRDVELGEIRLDTGTSVPGQVTLAEGGSARSPEGLYVGLRPYQRFPFMGENPTGPVDASGRFVLKRLFSSSLYWGPAVSSKDYLPAKGFYIKEAWMGGKDPRREPVYPGAGELRLVVGSDGAALHGRIVRKDDEPAADALAVLAPAPLTTAVSPYEILIRGADQHGRFEIESIPPGEYRLLAFEDVTAGEAKSAEFLRGYLSRATEIRLGPHETRTVSVRVISRQ